MRVFVLLALLLGTAQAATFHQGHGSFTALTTSPSQSSDNVECDGDAAVVFLWALTGTSFTGNLEVSIDNGTTWTDVTGSGTSTNGAVVSVSTPTGLYRPELSACTSCSVVVEWRCAAD